MTIEREPPKTQARPGAETSGDRPAVSAFTRGAEDARIIAAVLAGNREAFGDIIEAYQRPVLAAVRGYIKDQHLAEDVAQDVFVNAFSALPQLRQQNLFFPWLMQIARHRATQVLRREDVRSINKPLSGAEALPAAEDQRPAAAHDIFARVEQLPEPYRQTIILKYSQNLSCKEIAEQEGVAIGTITSRLTRALELLRNAL